jgi:serine/threonine-protein kinase RsbW
MSMAFFNAEVGNLAVIRRFVEETSQQMGADQNAIDDMIQAVDEAAANIIIHGYAGSSGILEIDITREDASLVVRLRDQAAQFDPTRIPAPDLSIPWTKRRPGGLGVYLIHQYVDKVMYRARPQGGNELTLIKKAF